MSPLSLKPWWGGGVASAFSLVEVVVALGIATFSLLVMIALLPMGFRIAGDTYEETRAVNMLSRIVADRRATPLNFPSGSFQLPPMTVTATSTTGQFGVAEDGNEVSAGAANEIYRVNYSAIAPTTGRKDPWLLWLRVSWPPKNTGTTTAVEALYTFITP